MPKTNTKPSKYPSLESIKKGIHQVVNSVAEMKSERGNTYFGIGMDTELVIDGVVGRVHLAWNNLRDASLAEAATVERAKASVETLSPEARKKLIAELSKGL